MKNWIGIGQSETGLVRTMNQDAFLVLDHLNLWAVADGMGGHVGGEIAAQLAIGTIRAQVESCGDLLHTGQRNTTDLLKEWVLEAHQAILRRASSEHKLRGMGTTIVLATILSLPTPTIAVAHVGDSRAYRFRSGTLTTLTKDHTLIEQYLSRGILTPESAKTHPERHVLTRALGMQSPVNATVSTFPLPPDDCFVLCSDGLTKMLEDEQIASILAETIGNPTHACDRLIKESLERGGEDNVTVIVIA